MAAIAPLKDLPAEQKLSAIEENDEELGSETEEYTSEDSEDHEEDGDDDPLFDPVEETLQSLSNLSLKKTRRRVSVKEDIHSGDDVEEAAKLDPKDEKSYDLVEKMIKDGKLEKLKVDQCKLYLRKHGLRLTGKKEVLLARVREHLEIVDGGGEKKYPVSSFTVNCQGDACMGDVVMFEQNVYEMFSIASRSATGPPRGTRTVAGRIVKESYGAAKQQHTFTIEVLWSKGEKPLPPLHPLLIKGRNLYRLKTMRQRWPNEGERKQVLQEKHMRGSSARFSREVRIQKKEARKLGGMKRTAENQGTIGANRMKQSNQLTVQNPRTKDTIVDNDISSQSLRAQCSDVSVRPVLQNSGKNSCNSRQPLKDFNFIQKQTTKASVLKQPILSSPPRYSYNYCKQPIMRLVPRENVSYPPHSPRYGHRQPFSFAYNQPTANLSSLPHSPRNGYNNRPPYGGYTDRQTLEYLNSQPHSSRNGYGNTNHPTQRQPCPYYPLGRCRYMDNCKFLHQ